MIIRLLSFFSGLGLGMGIVLLVVSIAGGAGDADLLRFAASIPSWIGYALVFGGTLIGIGAVHAHNLPSREAAE